MHRVTAAVAILLALSLAACGSTDVPTPASVEISASKDTLYPGDTARLTARVRAAAGSTIGSATVQWRSLNPSLVAVDSIGNAWAYGIGPAAPTAVTLEAASGDVVGRIDVVVRARPTQIFVKWPSRLRRIGSTDTLAAATYGPAGLVVTGAPLTWTSSDPSVISVTPNGIATMRRAGRALVTVSTGSVRDTLTIAVIPGFSFSDISDAFGDSITITATNDSGAYLGAIFLPDFTSRRFFWRNGHLSALPGCAATDLNNRFDVLCGSTIWNPITGARTPIAVGDTAISGVAINDSGAVFGQFPTGPQDRTRFGVWKNGTFTEKTFGAGAPGFWNLLDMNDREDILAHSVVFGYGYGVVRRLAGASTWTSLVVGRVGGSARMNNLGDVPLNARYPGMNHDSQGYVFLADARTVLIASDQTGHVDATVASLNDARDVVGTTGFDGIPVGYLWRGGLLGALDDLTNAPDWTITSALFIDNSGAITARAMNHRTARTAYVRLVPER